MSRIRSRDTGPEMAVRRMLHAAGYRYRLHRSDLPGRPDIVMPGRRTVILVHGCFWHRHPGCRLATTPATRTAFWLEKFRRNVERDRRVKAELEGLEWCVITVWECELRNPAELLQRLSRALNALG